MAWRPRKALALLLSLVLFDELPQHRSWFNIWNKTTVFIWVLPATFNYSFLEITNIKMFWDNFNVCLVSFHGIDYGSWAHSWLLTQKAVAWWKFFLIDSYLRHSLPLKSQTLLGKRSASLCALASVHPCQQPNVFSLLIAQSVVETRHEYRVSVGP